MVLQTISIYEIKVYGTTYVQIWRAGADHEKPVGRSYPAEY